MSKDSGGGLASLDAPSAQWTLPQKLQAICDEIFARWDADQRSGKLLTALAGRLPNYRADVTEVRRAVNAHDDLVASLRDGVTALWLLAAAGNKDAAEKHQRALAALTKAEA